MFRDFYSNEKRGISVFEILRYLTVENINNFVTIICQQKQ